MSAELKKILKILERQLELNDWVCEKVFQEKTGLNTKDKLRAFRRKNPTLCRASTQGRTDERERSINRNFIYNLRGWYELHQPLGKAS